MSKCGNCGGFIFKIHAVEPHGSRFKLYFVQCSSCGVPVGITEYHNVGTMVQGLDNKINRLIGEVEELKHNLSTLKNEIRQ